ncbi:SMP-30/gluconolactonase/LRE family protein [Aeromicrobium sp.]|uniref:SMP-30/gluconolactonase/LRE family protein n=1 Tax=Aeromicrobium sp. TaxID=1871063 RepID=UPI0025C6BDC6|nr:SMP-30/gluconolactonase/LRE family protein [Aeromicrobium sp.]MCK5892622.1 SMP-30/gluconolactonase/LRE family protein [Aeromicrobium sp.]
MLTTIEPFALHDLTEVGVGLDRPECVLAAPDGALYTGDWTLGIAQVAPDGTLGRAVEVDLVAEGFRPNGIAMTADGDFLFANMGRAGGAWRVGRHGPARPLTSDVGGAPVPRTNFVLADGDRAWVTVSSQGQRHEHFTAEEDSGQVLLVREGRTTVAAEGLNWTNEVRLSPDGRHLFVNETFACRTTRYDVAEDGSLSGPERVVYPADTFPDGMAFDSEGALWIACVITNRLLRLAPDLTWTMLLEDADPDAAALVASHAEGRLTWPEISASRGSRLANLSSIAFGGPDLTTIYLGGLGADRIHVLSSPVAGAPMEHGR